jgi:hypothetical protein
LANLIFLNLGIDSAWSINNALDLLYPVRNPHNSRALRSYQHLGLYLSRPGDLVLLPWSPDSEFLSWQKKLGLSFGTPLVVQETEFENGWERELEALASKHPSCHSSIFCGFSKIEAKISEIFKIKNDAKEKINIFSKLNNKNYIFQLCAQEAIPFPKSRIVNPLDWRVWLSSINNFPVLLKAPHSSGGGGLLEIKDKSDSILTHVERVFLKFNIQEKWILQNQYKKTADYSVCYEIENGRVLPKVAFSISYNRSRSSWRHKRVSLSGELEFFVSNGMKVGSRLLSEGFSGPFALDGFVTATGELFPAVDLNARFDKARLIHAAAEHYGLADAAYESRYLRIANAKGASFKEWFERVSDVLDHPFYPYHLGGGVSRSTVPRQIDLSYFLPEKCSNPDKSADTIAKLSLTVFGGELIDHGNDE